MTIRRFDLYAEPEVWAGNIQGHDAGHWAQWKEVSPYVDYALAHGYVPPAPIELPASDVLIQIERKERAAVTDDAVVEETTEDGDLYELITQQPYPVPLEE